MNKNVLRNRIKKKILTLSEKEKGVYEQKLHDRLLTSQTWTKAQTIGLTYSKDFEWDTTRLIREACSLGKEIALPKCFPKNHKLKYYKVESENHLETGYHHIIEPIPDPSRHFEKDQIDLLIVPGLV